MRIVIDMQGAQSTGSRSRGIGRYTMAFSQAIARNRGDHDVILALNGLFPETIEPIRAAFDGVVDQRNIRVWQASGPISENLDGTHWRRISAEYIRESFFASLAPDIVLMPSLFEGLVDDAVTSVGSMGHLPTMVTLHDLIPYIHSDVYLQDAAARAWYLRKIDHLRRADLLLAVSDSSATEAIDYLNIPSRSVLTVPNAVAPYFECRKIADDTKEELHRRYGLYQPFVMYGGGIDPRKNIEGLIRAFSRLPPDLRETHQLAIVCAARDEDIRRLKALGKKHGLSENDLVMTGFVPDEDLVALYNLCTLFVFPSWHEGFGLPVLEAMQCGAPVIGSDRSSVPEVIGWDEALFDPYSDDAIARAMDRALRDGEFQSRLARHGIEQSRRFSWDLSAKRAIAAFEAYIVERDRRVPEYPQPGQRPRLAYVSPLPPARSGIADYSAELLPELARHYRIELITDQEQVSDPQARACWPVRSVQWFVEHADEFDRVLYHFGNSGFHAHMFRLLSAVPGVVVLHDFFLSSAVERAEFYYGKSNAFRRALYSSHGYRAILDYTHSGEPEKVIWKYPCNLDVLQQAHGLIVHSAYSRELAAGWYGASQNPDWAIIPLMRQAAMPAERSMARGALGFSEEDFLVCSFGMLGPTKLNHRVLDAWLNSSLSRDDRCHLVFVGENHAGAYGQRLANRIRNSRHRGRIHVTGWADAATFRHYLDAADVGVQLRTLSRGETSAAVLDCMNHGIATIINVHGSMAEISDDAVWKLPDDFADEQLIEALESLCRDDERRTALGRAGRNIIGRDHNPRACGDRYASAIEAFYRQAAFGTQALVDRTASISGDVADDELIALADAISRSLPPRPRQRQMLVDISVLVQFDSRTGIQRVVRSLLRELVSNPPQGIRVEPVYATVDDVYRYARVFTAEFMGCHIGEWADEPIEVQAEDIFVGLDLQHHVAAAHGDTYERFRQQGAVVWFVVYDLLCVLMPQYFAAEMRDLHEKWLSVVAKADGAICISKAVANEFMEWVERNGPERQRELAINWFHLGADIENSVPTLGLPGDAAEVFRSLSERRTFLLVGTLEPRKGHAQVLAAAERLWEQGVDINLVFAGKQGWMVDSLIDRLRRHEELGARLFWLDGISDEYLEKVYAASTCLIAASEGEGFGLPLIEAAQHRLPIIARDIPVFREVAGDHAYYFPDDSSPEVVAKAVRDWLALYERGGHPSSEGMHWLTWQESAQQLLSVILGRESEEECRQEGVDRAP